MAPGTVMPNFKTRNKPEFADEDLVAWNPDHTGQKPVSDKKLRKSIRAANSAAEARAEADDA